MKAADVNEDQGGEYFDFSHVVAVFFDPLEEGLFDLNKMHRSKNVDHDTYAITLHLEIVCVNLSMRYYQAMIELGKVIIHVARKIVGLTVDLAEILSPVDKTPTT